MLWAILGIAFVATAEPRVLETLEGSEFARFGIVADLVERPAAISDEQFEQQLINAEGPSTLEWSAIELGANVRQHG